MFLVFETKGSMIRNLVTNSAKFYFEAYSIYVKTTIGK